MRHLLDHVLKYMLVRLVPEYLLGHMLEHVLRNVPEHVCLSPWGGTELGILVFTRLKVGTHLTYTALISDSNINKHSTITGV